MSISKTICLRSGKELINMEKDQDAQEFLTQNEFENNDVGNQTLTNNDVSDNNLESREEAMDNSILNQSDISDVDVQNESLIDIINSEMEIAGDRNNPQMAGPSDDKIVNKSSGISDQPTIEAMLAIILEQNNKHAEQLNKVDEQSKQLKEQNNQLNNKVDEQNKQLNNKLDELTKKNDSQLKQFADNTNKQFTQISRELKGVNDRFQEFKNDCQVINSELSKTVDSKIITSENKLTTKIEQIDSTLNKKVQESNESVRLKLNKIESDCDVEHKRVDSKLDQEIRKIRIESQAVIDQLEGRIEHTQSDSKVIESRVAQIENQQTQQSINMESNITEKVTEANKNMHEQLINIDKQITDVNKSVHERVNQLTQEVDSMKNKTRANISDFSGGSRENIRSGACNLTDGNLINMLPSPVTSNINGSQCSISNILPTTNRLPNPDITVSKDPGRIHNNNFHGCDIALPIFNDADLTSPLVFLKELDEYFDLKLIPQQYKIMVIGRCLRKRARSWYDITIKPGCSYEEFRQQFLQYYWSAGIQLKARMSLYTEKYIQKPHETLTDYIMKKVRFARMLQPPIPDLEILNLLLQQVPISVRNVLLVAKLNSVNEALEVLSNMELYGFSEPAQSDEREEAPRNNHANQNRNNQEGNSQAPNHYRENRNWNQNANRNERSGRNSNYQGYDRSRNYNNRTENPRVNSLQVGRTGGNPVIPPQSGGCVDMNERHGRGQTVPNLRPEAREFQSRSEPQQGSNRDREEDLNE